MPKNNIFSKKLLMVLGVLVFALSFVFAGVFAITNHRQTVSFSCVVLSTDNGEYHNALNGGFVEVDGKTIGLSGTTKNRAGKTINLCASPSDGYAFVGYFDCDVLLSTEVEYSVAPNENQTIVAKFAKEVEVSLQVQSPFDKDITQTINATCFVGQSLTINDIIQNQCDETWKQYYFSANAVETDNLLSAGYAFESNVMLVGAQNATIEVEPNETDFVGDPAVPSGYSKSSQVLVIYNQPGIASYSASPTCTTHVFKLKEEKPGYKVYTSNNWSFGYMFQNGAFQKFVQATVQEPGYIMNGWSIYVWGTYNGNSFWVDVTNAAGYGGNVGIIIATPLVEQGYVATFYSDDQTVIQQNTYKKNASINMPVSAPTKEGFTFAGWTTSPSSNVVQWSSGTRTLSQDTNFYPVWKRDNAITYAYINENGVRATVQDNENASPNFSVLDATAEKATFSIDKVPNASFEYNGKTYTFIGYSTEETNYSGTYANAGDVSGLSGTIEMYGAAKMLYAIYSTTVYITYNPNGGQNTPAQESTTICKSAGASEIQSQTLDYRLTSQTPTIEDGTAVKWLANNTQYDIGGVAPITWDTTFTVKWLIDHTLPGQGTAADPFTISSAREYKRFLSGVNDGRYSSANQYFKLLASFEIGYYEPVGIYDYSLNKEFPFMGNFDGNGQTLTLSSTGTWQNSNYVGIFGYNSGVIQNLSVAGNVVGENYVGGLCGYNTGKIIACTSAVNVYGSGSYVGGIVGVNNGLVDKCISSGNITSTNTTFALAFGGIAGINLSNATIRNAMSSGEVTALTTQWVGGITGQNHGNVINTRTFSVSKGAYYVGGIVGQNGGGNIFNSYVSGKAYSQNTYAGAIAGENRGTVQYAYYFINTAYDGNNKTQNAFGNANLGITTQNPNYVDSFSVEGESAGVQMEQGGRELSLKWALNLGLELFSLNDGNVYCSWEDDPNDGYATLFVDGWNNMIGQGSSVTGWTGSGTLQDPYQIGSIGDLQLLQEKVSFGLTYKGAYFVMTYDITFNDTAAAEWKPIGGANETESYVFEGTFDGQGHKISDVVINNSSNYQGIFGFNNGIIRNVVLANANIVGGSYVGGLVGYNTGAVMNCTFASGIVGGNGSYVGGIVGVNNGLIDKCISSGNTVGKNTTFGLAYGGITGINLSSAVVRNSLHSGAVSGNTSQWLGGIAGQNHGKIINVYNHGSVSGAYYVGGLVGQNGGGLLLNAYSSGMVAGINTYAGAIAGFDNGGEISFTYYLSGVATDGKNAVQNGIGTATLGAVAADKANQTTAFDENKGFSQIIVNGQTTSRLLEALNFGQKFYDSAEEGIYSIWTDDSNSWPSLLTNNEWNDSSAWFFSGEGTKANPYLIAKEDDLYYLALYVNSGVDFAGCYFSQTTDITISKYADSWNPIGTYNTKIKKASFFNGIFDGQYKKISGITTNTSANYQGLFGYSNGTIKNVAVVDANIVGGNYVGGIVGYNTGYVEDCYVNGQVKATGSYVGGIVGVNNGDVNKCYNLGSVVGGNSTFGLAVGGVIGINLTAANVYNVFNNGTVEANVYQWVGGIVGQNHGVLENAFNNGNVSGGYYIGGIAGQNGAGEINLAYNSGKITGKATFAGGICGFDNNGKIQHTYYLASSCTDVSGKAQNGIGCENSGEVTKDNSAKTWSFDQNGTMSMVVINNVNVSNLQTALKTAHARLSSVYTDKYCVWEERDDHQYPATCKTHTTPVMWNGYVANDTLKGDGTKTNPYLISTVEDLTYFAFNVNSGDNYSGKYVTLMADINFGGNASNMWSPIGWYDTSISKANTFAGTFDGNGHTISGLYTNTTNNYQGLFGYNAGTVKNLTVKGDITGGNYVGGIAGYNIGEIIFCKNECTAFGSGSYIGGIVGVNNGKVEGCYSTNAVSGNNATFGLAVGGVVGINLPDAKVENSFSNGNVSAGVYQWVGGVAGQNYGTISNCYATGDVEGGYYTGGVAGQNGAGTISNCISFGIINGKNTFVGGVVGFNNNGVLQHNYYLENKTFDGNATVQNGVGNEILGKKSSDVHGQFASFDANLEIESTNVFGTQTTNLVDALNAFVFENRQNGIVGDAWTLGANGMPSFGYNTLVWDGTSTQSYADGNGSLDDPYQIANASQFAYFANQVAAGQTFENKYFVLTQDIYLNHQYLETDLANANVWRPINGFAGDFNGQNFAIHGAFVNTIENNAGIFGKISGGLSNLCAANGFVQGLSNVGGIVGHTTGDMLCCVNENNVFGFGANVGGVVGFSSGMINACINSGTTVGTSENVGGIAGQAAASVVNSFNIGAIETKTSTAGGIVGVAAECAVVNCFNAGKVVGLQNIGGIVGCNQGAVQNCYNFGNVSGISGYVGGIVGKNEGNIETDYYLLNNTTCAGMVQFGVGAAAGKFAQDISGQTNYYTTSFAMSSVGIGNATISNLVDALNTWVGVKQSHENVALFAWKMGERYPVFERFWKGAQSTTFSGGNGTKENPYQIATANDLALLSKNVANGTTYLNKYFIMTNDIYLNDELFSFNPDTGLVMVSDGVNVAYLGTGIKGGVGENVSFDQVASSPGTWYANQKGTSGAYGGNINVWSPIGQVSAAGKQYAFAGHFDGDGHVVSGVYINASGTNQGLFGIVSGVVKSVGVVNSFIAGDMYIAGVVGNSTGALSNLFNESVVLAKTSAAGGVCGYANASASIVNCYNSGIVWGSASTGGVGGQILGSVQSIYNWGAAYQATNQAKALGVYTQSNLGTNLYAWAGSAAEDAKISVVTQDDVVSTTEALNSFASQNALLQWRIDTLTGKPSFFSSVVWDGGIAKGYEGGAGTESNPYLIANASQLAYFANGANRGSYAKIIKDIYLNDETFIFDADTGLIKVSDGVHTAYLGTGIKGDATGTNTTFDAMASAKGTWYANANGAEGNYLGVLNNWEGIADLKTSLDGDGHIIYGLYSTTSGLVLETNKGAVLKNLTIANSLVMGTTVGGVVNSSHGGTLMNLSNNATVLGTNSGGIVGEIIGTITTSKSQSQYNSGYSIYNIERTSLSNLENRGTIIGTNAAGISGTTQFLSKCENLLNVGKIYATSKAAGIVTTFTTSYMEEQYSLTITNLQNYGKITSSGSASGIIGNLAGGNYYKEWYIYTYYTVVGDPPQVVKAYDWREREHWPALLNISNLTNYGEVVGGAYTAGVLSEATRGDARTFTMSNFTNFGNIFGGNYTAGIVAKAKNFTIPNCINHGDVQGLMYTGGIVSYNANTITNAMNFGAISGTKSVGGIVGYAYDANYPIRDVYNFGDVSGSENVGGLIGELAGATVSNGHSGTTITASANTVGGLVGLASSGTLSSCNSTGEVYGPYYVGGVVGKADTGAKFTNCKYGYGLIFASRSTITAQGGNGVDVDQSPSQDNISGISRFTEDTLICVKGGMKVTNLELFFEKVGISNQGGGIYLVENSADSCMLDGAVIASKDYGILPDNGENVIMAYKAAIEVTAYLNGRGTLNEKNANGWQVDNTGQAAKQILFANVALGALPQPTDETYTFAGWYKDPECINKPVTEATTFDFDFTKLYAKWVITTYTMSINLESGTIPATEGWIIADDGLSATKKVQVSKTTGALPELSVPGYKFEGWFADPACTQRITQNTILWVKEDVQIYPKLTLNTFNMTIKLNNNEWAASGINIQIFKIGDVETKVFEATNIQDATFKIDQPFDAGYYRVLASQKATNLEQMVQLGALVWVEGETNYIVDYYSITLTKGDNGINCVYILEENGQVIETEDIHNNAQIYLRGQSIVISAVVAEKDGYSWNDWIDGDTGKPVRSGQDLTITSLEKPYVFTAQSK